MREPHKIEPREIELKLEVDPAGVEALRSSVLPRLGSGGETVHLVSTYFDTPGQALREHGISLRIRSAAGRRVQTVKCAEGLSAGLFDRSEWEAPVEADEPDRDALADTPARRVLAKAGEGLAPVFEVAVDRTLWQVHTGRCAVELALDQGFVSAMRQSRPLVELELELKRGAPSDLFDLLDTLGEAADLRIGVLTKSDRGYALIETREPRPVKAARVALRPGMSTAAAFQAVMHNCIRHFRLNEPLVAERRDREALHQARVAMRRLRSALSLFGPVVADAQQERLKQRLRDASRTLGEARNLDVALARPAEPGEAPGAEVEAHRADLQARRTAAYDAVIEMLASRAFCRLMLDLLSWVEAGPWLAEDEPQREADRSRAIEQFASRTLQVRRRKVKTKGRHLADLDPEARHRVRIQAKKLRYAAEFFEGLVDRRKDRRRYANFIEVMEALQKHLGELNDIQTGHELAGAATSWGDAGPIVAGAVVGHDPRVVPLLGKAAQAHHRFRASKRFWTRWAEGAPRPPT